MKMRLYLIFVIIFLLTGCASKYQHLYNEKSGFYSYISSNVHDDRIIDEYFSEVYVAPASCQKVITSLVALKTLGPKYQYETTLFAIMKNNQINNLVIKFSGDPTLTSAQLTALLKPLQGRKINGYIFLDASLFKTTPYSHNLMIDDIGTDYATPVSAINIDKNLVTLKIFPKKMGELAAIKSDVRYKIKSDVITNDEKTSVKLTWVDGIIHAKGNINSMDALLELKISPRNHDEYVLRKVKLILSSLDITGKIKVIKNKEFSYRQSKSINKIKSSSLAETIKFALKISDNLVFDSIYLSIVNSYADEEIKDWEQGSNIIQNLIKKHFGIDTGSALFVDGSGLSRYNRIQPKTLLFLLKTGFDIPEFVDALAMPGEEDSTLKNRTQLASKIKAKTGNMSGISCLCGYNLAMHNPKAFVFMANSFAPPSKDLFELMDNFVSRNLEK